MFGLHLHEAEIDVIVQDQLLHLTGPADLDLDFKIRKFGLQLANQPRQQMGTDGDGRADAHGTQCVPVSHLRLHLVDQRDDMNRIVVKRLPADRRQQLASCARKKRDAVVILQLAQRQTDRRLGPDAAPAPLW